MIPVWIYGNICRVFSILQLLYIRLKGCCLHATVYSERGLASRWLERAALVKSKTIEKMWLEEGYFAKCIADGKLDTTVDASMIGTFTPFNMLSPKDPQERKMIYSMLSTIESRLSVNVNGSNGIKRYENDKYIEGNPWVVTTLWLSKAMLTLANSLRNEPNSENEVSRLVQGSVNYIKWVLKGTTSAGMLPEQVDKQKGHPAWAIPLGWSCALMIDNILLLETFSEETHDGKI
jgi:GH15 family glucan-1,4-alpha-glucosidase